MNVGALGFLRMHAGQPGGTGPGMVARAIAQRLARVVVKATHHQQLFAELFQRLQGFGELKVTAIGCRRPVLHDDAVGHIEERHAHRRRARALAGGGESRSHRIQNRQGQSGTEAAQKEAAV